MHNIYIEEGVSTQCQNPQDTLYEIHDIRINTMKLGIGYFQRMETQAKTVLIRSCLIFLRISA